MLFCKFLFCLSPRVVTMRLFCYSAVLLRYSGASLFSLFLKDANEDIFGFTLGNLVTVVFIFRGITPAIGAIVRLVQLRTWYKSPIANVLIIPRWLPLWFSVLLLFCYVSLSIYRYFALIFLSTIWLSEEAAFYIFLDFSNSTTA